jgi:glutaredoxin 3
MKITIYSKPNCPYCTMAKNLAEMKGAEVRYLMLGEDFDAKNFMAEFPTARTFPQIIMNGKKIGGYTELEKALSE